MSYPKGPLPQSVVSSIVLLGLTISLLAQYAVDWAVVSNGSGTSSSDRYVLEGTIGQTIAGTQAGGPYLLTTGFWSLVTTIPTPEAPVLRVAWDGSGVGPKILWAKPAEGRVLQQTNVLKGPDTEWIDVDGPYVDAGSEYEVVAGAPLGQGFHPVHFDFEWFTHLRTRWNASLPGRSGSRPV